MSDLVVCFFLLGICHFRQLPELGQFLPSRVMQ